ncbi:SRPBCC family protein [Streptomyces sp. NPDC049910]|uniref:SRPBCC family protein n=1 Tax=Streptomyces sp. NPDC049910 TaxID=3155278 RepID=UPI00342C3D29
MELRHEFTVPVPVEEAWRMLLDIERVAPCLPGTTVQEVDGEKIAGTVKVKVGPVTLTYRGTAVFEERDEAAHRMVLKASGKEVRGQGTARATVTAGLTASGEGTAVSVLTDFAVTGRPAQIGRGVLAEVGEKLVGRFADCLSGQLGRAQGGEAQSGGAAEAGAGGAAGGSMEPGTGAGAGAGAGTGAGAGADAEEAAVPGAEGPSGTGSAVAEPGGPAAPTAREEAGRARAAEAGPEGAAEPIDLLRTAGLPVTRRILPWALAAAAAAAAVAVAVRCRRR